MGYKPGSRIAQMFARWTEGGTEAAMALGPSLNLSPSTMKNWCRVWDKGTRPDEKKEKAPKEPKSDLPKRIKGYKTNYEGKRRVTCSYFKTKRVGYLIEEGPEVSIVKWEDDYPETAIINKYLKDVTSTGAKK